MLRYWLPLLLLFSVWNVPAVRSQADNKTVIREVLTTAYSEGDLSTIQANFAQGYMRLPGEADRAQFEGSILGLRAAMPDLQVSIDVLIAQDNRVAARYRLSGTFVNELIFPNAVPIPPTGQPFSITVHSLYVFDENGQVVQEWNGFDNLIFLVLIGVLPPPQVSDLAPPPILPLTESEIADQNRLVVRSYFDAYNNDQLAGASGFFTEDFVATTPFGAYPYAGLIDDVAKLRGSMPNLTVTLNETVTEGNWTAALYTIRGTFLEDYTLPDGTVIPATAGIVELPVITFFGFNEQGQVVQAWELYDSWDFLTQLGLALPSLPGEGE